MKWWYENEEEEMKLTLVDYDKEGKPFHRDVVVPKTAEEARRLEMEFDKSRVYTALNADELKQGDKVIVADSIHCLEVQVKGDVAADTICQVNPPTWGKRFSVGAGNISASLAYLVERAENCINCGANMTCGESVYVRTTEQKVHRCENYKPKTGQMCLNCKHYNKVNDFRDCTLVDNPTGACPHYEAEKKYRPFKDVDELVKVWDAKIGTPRWGTDGDLTMPHIWVKHKQIGSKSLITDYVDDYTVIVGNEGNSLQALFDKYTFLDGSPCGVEE